MEAGQENIGLLGDDPRRIELIELVDRISSLKSQRETVEKRYAQHVNAMCTSLYGDGGEGSRMYGSQLSGIDRKLEILENEMSERNELDKARSR